MNCSYYEQIIRVSSTIGYISGPETYTVFVLEVHVRGDGLGVAELLDRVVRAAARTYRAHRFPPLKEVYYKFYFRSSSLKRAKSIPNDPPRRRRPKFLGVFTQLCPSPPQFWAFLRSFVRRRLKN